MNIAAYVERSPHGLDVPAVLDWCVRARADVAAQSPVMLNPPPLCPDEAT